MKSRLLGAICIGIVQFPMAHANLLVNGSFEEGQPVPAAYNNPDQPDRLFNQSDYNLFPYVVPGWDFNIGVSSDILRDMNAVDAVSDSYRAADGDYFAGSGAIGGIPFREGIEQTFTVAANTSYELSFSIAPGNVYSIAEGWLATTTGVSGWEVTLSGAVVSDVSTMFDVDPLDFDPLSATVPTRWTTKTVSFESNATGGDVTLGFTSYDFSGNGAYVFIDNAVADVAAVPVPAAIWLFGSGSIGLLGLARRKR